MRVEVKVTLYHKPLKSFFACYVKQTQKPTDTLTGSNSSLLRTPPNPVVIGRLNVVSSVIIKGQIKTSHIWIDLIISVELLGTEETLFFPFALIHKVHVDMDCITGCLLEALGDGGNLPCVFGPKRKFSF